MGFDVSGKVAIVTGSGRGFGKEFAIRLLMKKAKVCISDINEETGLSTLKELEEKFGDNNVTFCKCNVVKEADWEILWSHTEDKFQSKVDMLVNNAGLNPNSGWKLCLDVMLYGVMIGTFMARDRMGNARGGNGGRIINIASCAGILSEQTKVFKFDGVGYPIAKTAVVTLTRIGGAPGMLQTEGIKMYALLPWFAETKLVTESMPIKDVERISKQRVLTVEEVGDAFDQSICDDTAGSCWVIFPDSLLCRFPCLNYPLFVILMMYGTFAQKYKPNWMRFDGKNAVIVSLFIAFILMYLLFYMFAFVLF